MPEASSNVLTLDQSYQAAFLWFDHKGEPPDEITEPAHGSVQLITERTFARVRWSDKPVEQTSVLALLKAAPQEKRLVIFSASGFTTGAISVAESQGIALYSFDASGIAHPETTRAKSLTPSDTQEPPFPPPEVETEDDEDFWAQTRPHDAGTDDATAHEYSTPLEAHPDDWTDCPSCGTTHFRTALFCRSCGAHLETGDPHPHNATVDQLGLRCRTCNGTDIAIGDHSG